MTGVVFRQFPNLGQCSRLNVFIGLVLMAWFLVASCETGYAQGTAAISVHPDNRRYFKRPGSDQAVYLAGSHHRQNIQDVGPSSPPDEFKFDSIYPVLPGHNFIRGWHWEHSLWLNTPPSTHTDNDHIFPIPFARPTGGGNANDGLPKFDLLALNPDYLMRLRDRIDTAQRKNMLLSVMLFQGFSVQSLDPGEDPVTNHPFNVENNRNGINGDFLPGNDPGKRGLSELHTVISAAPVNVRTAQDNYVTALVSEFSDSGNIIWEVSNESNKKSLAWHEHIAGLIRGVARDSSASEESESVKQSASRQLIWFSHPQGVDNLSLFNSSAEVISPSANEPAVTASGLQVNGALYRTSPPASSGEKVIILDTDHMKPKCDWCNRNWPWKAFTRGYHIALLDDLDSIHPGTITARSEVREAMADTVRYSEKINLVAMAPQNEISSTPCDANSDPEESEYCLFTTADPDPLPYVQPEPDGREYLVLDTDGGALTLSQVPAGDYQAEWFNVDSGNVNVAPVFFHAGGDRSFQSPFAGQSSVLWLRRVGDGLPPVVEGFTASINGEDVDGLSIYVSNPVIDFSWVPAPLTSAIDLYQVEVREFPGQVLIAQSQVLFPDTSGSISVSGLRAGQDYQLRVRARNLAGVWSSWESSGVFSVLPPEQTCVASPTRMCLRDGRFQVEVRWTDTKGATGLGSLADFGTDESGLFWFFNPNNLEFMVKVLDGCPVNGHFWVFAAATTNVGYDLIVTDTVAGLQQVYSNPAGTLAPAIADTAAFDACDQPSGPLLPAYGDTFNWSSGLDCTPAHTMHCLRQGRFKLELSWRDTHGNTGSGRTVPYGTDESALFWFFSANNWEMLVKVLDGCPVNGHYWVFAAATTNVEYDLVVTDTLTGQSRVYNNELGQLADAVGDTAAFASCP